MVKKEGRKRATEQKKSIPTQKNGVGKIEKKGQKVLAVSSAKIEGALVPPKPTDAIERKKKKKTSVSRGPVSSNWKTMELKIRQQAEVAKRREGLTAAASTLPPSVVARLTGTLALDCEMVGVGPGGKESALARVTLINERLETVLDLYVRPTAPVTDYRTDVSGIRPIDLRAGAIPMDSARRQVLLAIKGRVLVGHSLKHDFAALQIRHPVRFCRDSARFLPLMRDKEHPFPLRTLAQKLLGLEIQSGSHSSIEDACASMRIYLQFKREWDIYVEEAAKRRIERNNRNKSNRASSKRTTPKGARAAPSLASGAEGADKRLEKAGGDDEEDDDDFPWSDSESSSSSIE